MQVADSLSGVEAGRLSGASRQDIRLAGEIIGLVYKPDELRYGNIVVQEPSEGKLVEVARIPWDGDEYDFMVAEKAGYGGHSIRSTEPALRDKHLPAHLLPHFRQAAMMRGLGLPEYVCFLRDGGLRTDLDWLRLPYTVNYEPEGHIISGNVLSFSHRICERKAERAAIRDLVERRMAGGDFTLHIKSCGCGITGNEPYGYAMVAYDVLREVGRGLSPGAGEAEAARWADKWELTVTGYAISPLHLETAEKGEVWTYERLYREADPSNIFFKYVGEARVDEREKNAYFKVNPEIRRLVGFEWMDLLDTRQLERLSDRPADLLVLDRVFYLYSQKPGSHKPQWLEEPMSGALHKIIGSIREGGVFITDNDVYDVRNLSFYAGQADNPGPKPPLYFSWRGLREVPWDGGMMVFEDHKRTAFPISAEEAAAWDARNRWDVYSRLFRAYQDEIIPHGGRMPSGIYVKEG